MDILTEERTDRLTEDYTDRLTGEDRAKADLDLCVSIDAPQNKKHSKYSQFIQDSAYLLPLLVLRQK